MKNQKQKGFGLVETLLVILILAVVGLAGYAVWHNQHKAKATSNSSQASQSTPIVSSVVAKNGTVCSSTKLVGSDYYCVTLSGSYQKLPIIENNTVKTDWQDLPADLQEAVRMAWSANCAPGASFSSDNLTEINMTKDAQYFNLIYTCGGEGAGGLLLAKSNGGWVSISTSSVGAKNGSVVWDLASCLNLQQYRVPSEILTANTDTNTTAPLCGNDKGQLVVYNIE